MADEVDTPIGDDDDDFTRWLAELEDEETAAVAPEDDKALKVAQQTKKVVSEFITEQKTEEMVDKFLAEASQDAQDLFTVYRTGDESPKQLRRLMELAVAKASQIKGGDDVERRAQELADKKAREDYGVAPVGSSGGAPPREMSAEEVYDQLAAQARQGDTHASFLLWKNLPAESPASQQ